MGIFTPIGNFLFGKDPDIFDENGNVSHKHPKKKWDAWANKMKLDPSYNWRHHNGMQGGAKGAGIGGGVGGGSAAATGKKSETDKR